MRNEKEVTELYNDGKSPSEISKILGVCRRSIYRLINRKNLGLKIDKKNNLESGLCECCGKIFNQLQEKNRKKCNSCNTAIRRVRLKIRCIEYKGGCCVRCGLKTDNISVYDFHHLDPEKKDFELGVTKLGAKSWNDILPELDKCILVCSNCHRIEHSQYKMFQKYL